MADKSNTAKSPWPKSLGQVLHSVKQRCESYPLLKRLSTVVTTWLSPHTDNHTNNQPPRAVFAKSGDLWPCGSKDKPLRLSYSFFRPANNITQRNRESKVQAVIKRIEEKVPGVKFDRLNKDSDAVIRIAFNHNHIHGRTWSRVGREAEAINSDEPTMNLSDIGHESGEIREGSKEYGDIMHEFFHTLGMLHEHQHPDRKFAISATAVGRDLEDWSETDISDNIVRKFRHNDTGALSQPDMASSMNYHIPREWTKDGSEVKRTNKPSDLDFAWLNLMYPPQNQRKFEQALSESMNSRISKDHRRLILRLYLEGEWEKLRSKVVSISNPKSDLKVSKKGLWART